MKSLFSPWQNPGPALPGLLLILSLVTEAATAQSSTRFLPTLSEDRYKSGAILLYAFTPVSDATRHSIVKLNLNGETVAMGAVIDANGLVITKASEIKEGKLTCKLANGEEVSAQWLASDDDNDVALVKVATSGLKPVQWASADAAVGQWVATPGLGMTPEAVGIVSVPPRKIMPKRAIIGVMAELDAPTAKIGSVSPGLGADKAGLKPGDVILSVNEKRIEKWEELYNTLGEFSVGQIVKLRVSRGEQEFEVSIEMMSPSETTIGALQDTNAPNAKIAKVAKGLGAEKAGLKAGDVILAINEKPVEKWDDLLGSMRRFREGQIVRVRVLRDEREFDARVEIASETLPPPSTGRGRGGRGASPFNRQERMNRMGGELSRRAEDFELAIQHDTVLQPWQCGGPLVNLDGIAVGLNIARAGRVASYALPAVLVKHVIEDLRAQAEKAVKSEKAPQAPRQ